MTRAFKQSPGLCLDQQTPECPIPLKDRGETCPTCQKKHVADTLNISPSNITLEHITAMGPRESVQYIYKNTLRTKNPYSSYRPISNNPLSRGRGSIHTKSFENLSMGQIYHIFNQMIIIAEENTRKQLTAKGTLDKDIAIHIQSIRDQRFEGDSERKKDPDGNLVLNSHGHPTRNEYKDLVTEAILYNINIEKLTENNITHTVGKLDNTIFNADVDDDIIADLREKFSLFRNTPVLTNKKNNYEKISDQIKDIIDGKATWPNSIEQTPENKNLLEQYLLEVRKIEGLIASHADISDYVVKKSLDGICDNLKNLGIEEKDIFRVKSKDTVRSVEKTLTKNKFDLRKLTDMSRGSIKCRSVKDLIDKMGKLHTACIQHNKSRTNTASLPSVVEMGLVSKFGSIMATGPLPSGYRDAKYHIKLSNGAVFEMQFQVDILHEGKHKGFDTLNGLSNAEVIKGLNFSEEEKQTIRTTIDEYNIDVGGDDFFDLPSDCRVAGDVVYHIYRSLPGFDPKDSSNPIIQKLQLYEREIHSEGRLRNMKDIMRQEQQEKHNKRDDKLKQNLI